MKAKVKVLQSFALTNQGSFQVGDEVLVYVGKKGSVALLTREEFTKLIEDGKIEQIKLPTIIMKEGDRHG